jgi:hypothetical protein
MLSPYVSDVQVEWLDDATLWSRKIDDERYTVLATRRS